jgi:hypothetical protein
MKQVSPKVFEFHTARVSFSLPNLIRPATKWIICAGALAVTLGLARELYIGLLGKSTAIGELQLIALFDVPTAVINWIQSAILLLDTAALALIMALARTDSDADWRRWRALAVVFALMSLDEAVNAHQIILSPLHERFGVEGAGMFVWMAPAFLTVAAVGFYVYPMVHRLPRHHAVRFTTCAVLFLSGAIGMEIVSTNMGFRFGIASIPYVLAASTEETLETIGAVLFFCALASYLAGRWPSLTIGHNQRPSRVG